MLVVVLTALTAVGISAYVDPIAYVNPHIGTGGNGFGVGSNPVGSYLSVVFGDLS